MKKGLTKLDENDYSFLERFLDVTKANLFFAKGVIMVEGWAEEILIPALARKMKSCKMIDRDLTEASVSIVNVGNTAFLRYSKIFLRTEDSVMGIPVAIITDVDVREYQVSRIVDGAGKTMNDYIKRDFRIIEKASADKIKKLKDDFDDSGVKVFVAPNWTLEYSILKSNKLSPAFKSVFKKVHSGIDENDVEKELAKKLIAKSLAKTDIAYQLSQILDDDNKKAAQEILLDENDYSIKYLMDAIKYACAN